MKCPTCSQLTTRAVCLRCNSDTIPCALPATSMFDDDYWEEKAADEAQMYREEEAAERKRMFPTGE